MKNEWMDDDDRYEQNWERIMKQWIREKEIYSSTTGPKNQSLQFIGLVQSLTHLVTSQASNHS
jgi:hypothetical protein